MLTIILGLAGWIGKLVVLYFAARWVLGGSGPRRLPTRIDYTPDIPEHDGYAPPSTGAGDYWHRLGVWERHEARRDD